MDKLQLKPSDTIALLAAAIEDGEPVFVAGSKGIGKSDCIAEAAKQTGHDLLMSYPAVEDPTAASGVPWPRPEADEVKMLPYGELAAAMRCVKPTVWGWDDLPHAAPAVQASRMQLLLARAINGFKLPDHVKIVAAGNLRKAGYGTHGMLEPVKGRFTLIEMVPDLDDFCNWCYAHNQPPEGIAFIRTFPTLLCPEALDPEYKANVADYVNTPNPRNWVRAFAWLNRNVSEHVRLAGFAGRVGLGPASQFKAYVDQYRQMPSIDGIILDPDKAPIPGPDKLSVLHAIAVGLAYKANAKNFDRICRYAERLFNSDLGDFGVLIVRDSARRHPQVQTTPAWNKVASSPLGKMFTGGSDDD
jgi:hypothetical protein